MMPLQALRRTLLLLLPATLCACSSIEPQGALKAVMGGDIFEGAPRDPEEAKRIEKERRELNRQTPAPTEKRGPLGFRIPL